MLISNLYVVVVTAVGVAAGVVRRFARALFVVSLVGVALPIVYTIFLPSYDNLGWYTCVAALLLAVEAYNGGHLDLPFFGT